MTEQRTMPTVLMAASECRPFAKTGGLADVVEALSRHLARQGVPVRVVIPWYQEVARGGFHPEILISDVEVRIGHRVELVEILRLRREENLEILFVRHDPSFMRPSLYGPGNRAYPDNAPRFGLFARTVAMLANGLTGPVDLVHAHEWQTGLVPLFLTASPIPTVFTLHNAGYQGNFERAVLDEIGIPPEHFHPEGIEFYGRVNFLKAGIVWSRALTTVSPTYAKEIQTPAFGFGLDGLIRKHAAKLHGILNGVDYEVWNPAADPHLPSAYTASSMDGKRACKLALLRTCGLPERPDVPLLGVISRLVHQKGIDILVEALPRLLGMDLSLVVLGTGQPEYEHALLTSSAIYPNLQAIIGFDDAMAHRIEAGCDIFLMPSRYEPCGLNQIYSLRYGTVPVVRGTGGLLDSVEPWDTATRRGTGFVFKHETSAHLVDAVTQALAVYAQQDSWRQLVANGMSRDFSWSRAAGEYLQLYRRVVSGDLPSERSGP